MSNLQLFNCEKCGACCRYHKCKYLKDNLCSIYESRPDRCRVDKQNIDYGVVKIACNLLRLKEWLDPIIESFFDKKYDEERKMFRRDYD